MYDEHDNKCDLCGKMIRSDAEDITPRGARFRGRYSGMSHTRCITKWRGIKLNRCYGCGSDDIELYDCGYSSFNACGGKCLACGFKVSCSRTGLDQKGLAFVWNDHRKDVVAQLKKLRKELRQSRR
jgi:hypothetical protein